MNENRMKILKMLADGKISADEAERLIAALETGSAAGDPTSSGAANSRPQPRYLRVVATEQKANGEPMNVNVRVPIKLLRAGVKLTGLIPQIARDRVNEQLRREGVDLDLNQITPQNLDEVITQLDELTVDVDDNGKTKVRVFCE